MKDDGEDERGLDAGFRRRLSFGGQVRCNAVALRWDSGQDARVYNSAAARGEGGFPFEFPPYNSIPYYYPPETCFSCTFFTLVLS
jgi:hypothetical protein